jgi:hypothetical protein
VARPDWRSEGWLVRAGAVLLVVLVVWLIVQLVVGFVFSLIRMALLLALFAVVAWIVLVGPPERDEQ